MDYNRHDHSTKRYDVESNGKRAPRVKATTFLFTKMFSTLIYTEVVRKFRILTHDSPDM